MVSQKGKIFRDFELASFLCGHLLYAHLSTYSGFPGVAQSLKNPPAMQETCVLSLDWEDPLGKGMATHSSILAWRIPWTEELGSL